MFGTVTEFDEHRGDGVIVDDDGTQYYFHCVHIADGTRIIDVGNRVTWRRAVGLLGHDEARDIRLVN